MRCTQMYTRRMFRYLAMVLMVVPPAVTAFQITPMNIQLTPQGNGRSTTLTVDNSNPEPIAVQIRVLGREVLPDGSEQNGEIEAGLFRVYPSQLIVPAGASQVVRLQYTGPEDVDVEQAYRLEARQLPINIQNRDADQGTGVKIVLRYLATVYVGPRNARPEFDLSVRDLDLSAGTGELVIANRGTGHADLIGRAVVLSSGEGETVRRAVTDFGGNYAASLPAGFVRVIPLEGVLTFEPETLEIVTD
jgi:fimbrial chaperone protein